MDKLIMTKFHKEKEDFKMKPKRFKKKLALNKKTVANLSIGEKQAVKGGAEHTIALTCSCVPPCESADANCVTQAATCNCTATCLTICTCGDTCHTCTGCPPITIAYTCTC